MAAMRVVQVIGAMDRGGAETMLMNAYRAMDRSRVQFDFLVHEQRVCDYDEEIESLGGRVYRALPRFTGLNGAAYRKAVRAFLAQHPEHEVVHGHIGSSAAIYLGEAKRAGRVAVAHSHAQNYPLSAGELAFRALSYPVRFKADYFLACSEQAGIDRFGRAVVEGERFHVLRNGIDVAAFACTDKQHRQAKQELCDRLGISGAQGPVLIGHVGRFDPVKNHRFLIETFTQVKRDVPAAHLLLVGRGPEEAAIREQVRAAGLESSVHFLGVTDDVPAVLHGLDAFVLPSFREGLSMAAVEAQATGVPCVLSDGVPDEAILPGTPVARISLADGLHVWATAIGEAARIGAGPAWPAEASAGGAEPAEAVASEQPGAYDRILGAEAARGAGYDIHDTACWLQEFYERIAPAR